jgi:predicted acyltransferase
MRDSTSRLASLDAFRGFTIAAMVLVNNPGDWGHLYSQLDHAKWNGWTFTDCIFPFFLFIGGVAMALSLGLQRESHRADRVDAAGRPIVPVGRLDFGYHPDADK